MGHYHERLAIHFFRYSIRLSPDDGFSATHPGTDHASGIYNVDLVYRRLPAEIGWEHFIYQTHVRDPGIRLESLAPF